jgi:predicted dehydrogenase
VGEENNLLIRIYGTEASLEWRQEDPNDLIVRYPDRPLHIYKRGNDYLADAAKHNSRLPSGHPEAFIEAFANIYRNAACTIAARLARTNPSALALDYPTVQDGARGVHFILTALQSGRQRGWVDASYRPPS